MKKVSQMWGKLAKITSSVESRDFKALKMFSVILMLSGPRQH